jgi:hypothetical protein
LKIKWTHYPGVECEVEEALSLPGEPDDKRPRPGLSVLLVVDGKRLRVMTVHLKSSCESKVAACDTGDSKGDHTGTYWRQWTAA